MIDVEIWNYVESKSRMVRFSRKVSVETVPFIGSEIAMSGDHIIVDRVTFNDGGGVVCIAYNDPDNNGNKRLWEDSELDEIIGDMEDIGWVVLSNVKKRGIKKK